MVRISYAKVYNTAESMVFPSQNPYKRKHSHRSLVQLFPSQSSRCCIYMLREIRIKFRQDSGVVTSTTLSKPFSTSTRFDRSSILLLRLYNSCCRSLDHLQALCTHKLPSIIIFCWFNLSKIITLSIAETTKKRGLRLLATPSTHTPRTSRRSPL